MCSLCQKSFRSDNVPEIQAQDFVSGKQFGKPFISNTATEVHLLYSHEPVVFLWGILDVPVSNWIELTQNILMIFFFISASKDHFGYR